MFKVRLYKKKLSETLSEVVRPCPKMSTCSDKVGQNIAVFGRFRTRKTASIGCNLRFWGLSELSELKNTFLNFFTQIFSI